MLIRALRTSRGIHGHELGCGQIPKARRRKNSLQKMTQTRAVSYKTNRFHVAVICQNVVRTKKGTRGDA